MLRLLLLCRLALAGSPGFAACTCAGLPPINRVVVLQQHVCRLAPLNRVVVLHVCWFAPMSRAVVLQLHVC